MLAKEGASHLVDTLGMHFSQPEELQLLDREVESAHRHRHHAMTRYEPDRFDLARHELDRHDADLLHERRHVVEEHGLPVHDRYGLRTVEHDPYHHEFVHGTNYEIDPRRASPVVEHNPHAFPTEGKKPSSAMDTKQEQKDAEQKTTTK